MLIRKKDVYSIKRWDECFEVSQSRREQPRVIGWVAVPNKHDGKGYKRIARHQDAVSLFCCWNLIVQIASKQPIRGILADEDGPLSFEDMADETGFPVGIFAASLPVFLSDAIGWMETTDYKSFTELLGVRSEEARSALSHKQTNKRTNKQTRGRTTAPYISELVEQKKEMEAYLHKLCEQKKPDEKDLRKEIRAKIDDLQLSIVNYKT